MLMLTIKHHKLLKNFLHTIILGSSLLFTTANSDIIKKDFLFQPYDTENNNTSNYINQFSEKNHMNIDLRYKKLGRELAYMQVFAVATIGIIAILPEGISKWSSEDKTFVNAKDLLQKHADNISKGPIWDNDAWQVNYIGHPIAGSYFYVWGRQSGLSWQESAILTTIMSTFYWEYGWEAFAEVPSIQDLIVTPVLGSLLGEYSNHLYSTLMSNNGKIYDSFILGGIGRALLNPIGEMNTYLDRAFNAANIEISVDYAYNQNKDTYRLQQSINQNGIVQSYFKFNFTLKY